jgi:hypothetical protein
MVDIKYQLDFNFKGVFNRIGGVMVELALNNNHSFSPFEHFFPFRFVFRFRL